MVCSMWHITGICSSYLYEVAGVLVTFNCLKLFELLDIQGALFLRLNKNLWSLLVATKIVPVGLPVNSVYLPSLSLYWKATSLAYLTAPSGTGSERSSFFHGESNISFCPRFVLVGLFLGGENRIDPSWQRHQLMPLTMITVYGQKR